MRGRSDKCSPVSARQYSPLRPRLWGFICFWMKKPYVPYSEKLKDPRWQKKRLKVLEYAEWKCQLCGVQHKTLHVHHSYYLNKKEPWQYPTGSFIAVCESCHDVIHKTVKQKDGPNALGRWKLIFESYYPHLLDETGKPPPLSFDKTTKELAADMSSTGKFAALKAMLERAEG